MELARTSGGVLCLFDELHKEAQRRLRAMGARGKVLSLTTIARDTHLDYKAFFAMQNNTLKQYDAEVVKRLCLYFGIDIGQFFYRAGSGRDQPHIADLAVACEPLPHDTGTIESLIPTRVNEWRERTGYSLPPSFTHLGELVGLHPQTVSAWVHNEISIYSLVVLEKWCVFFETDIEAILRYVPPQAVHIDRTPLPSRSTSPTPPPTESR